MTAYVVTTAAAGTATTPALTAGQVVALTDAQEAALSADVRAVTVRDQAGESFGVSN